LPVSIVSIKLFNMAMNLHSMVQTQLLNPYIRNTVVLQSGMGQEAPVHLPCFADGLPGILFWQTDRNILLNQDMPSHTSLRLYGQTIKPVELMATGNYRIIIIHLYPHVLESLFGIQAGELTDTCVDVNQLPIPGVPALQAQLLEAGSAEEQKNLLLAFLATLTRSNQVLPEKDIAYVTHQLMRTKGNTPLKVLQQELHLSERSFERKFLRQVGIPARLYARICRFNAALSQIRQGNWFRLTDVAYDNGFADQAHLNRTFKEFTGFTPGAYLARYRQQAEVLPVLSATC
jgi:AraC-like DNA-binding protein